MGVSLSGRASGEKGAGGGKATRGAKKNGEREKKKLCFRGTPPLGRRGQGAALPLPPRHRPAWPQTGSCRRRSRHGGGRLHQVHQISALRLQLHLLGEPQRGGGGWAARPARAGVFPFLPPPPTNQPAPVLRFAPCYQGFGRRGAFILCYFFFFYAWQTQLYLFMYLFTRHVYIYSRRWIYFYVCGSSAQGRGFGSALLGSLSSPRTPHCPWVFRLPRAGWAEPPPVRRGRVKRGRLGPVLPLAAWSGPGGRAGRCLWELSGAGGCSQGAEVCFPEKVSRGIIRLPGYGGGSGSSCGGGRSPLASLPVFPQFWVRR